MAPLAQCSQLRESWSGVALCSGLHPPEKHSVTRGGVSDRKVPPHFCAACARPSASTKDLAFLQESSRKVEQNLSIARTTPLCVPASLPPLPRLALRSRSPTTAPMHWVWPLVTLSVFLSCTTVLYHFKTPSTIAVGSSSSKRAPEAALASVWGAVDSDFDWCEHNYLLSAYVAEPLNSVTSTAYPILALYAWRTHHHLAVSPYLKLALVVTV